MSDILLNVLACVFIVSLVIMTIYYFYISYSSRNKDIDNVIRFSSCVTQRALIRKELDTRFDAVVCLINDLENRVVFLEKSIKDGESDLK